MSVSFEEKSVWIQLVSMVVVLGYYFSVAWKMWSRGVDVLIVFVPVFTVAVVAIVIINVVGHIAIAVVSRADDPDERDRLVCWRADSNSSWIMALGIVIGITGLIFSINTVWVAHFLLFSLFASDFVKYTLQIIYYRRGM